MSQVKGSDPSSAGASISRQVERHELRQQEVKKGEEDVAQKSAAEEAARIARNGWLANFVPTTTEVATLTNTPDGQERIVTRFDGNNVGQVTQKQKLPDDDKGAGKGWTPPAADS
jgi:hypothetical protein